MKTPDNLRYTKSHEWVRSEGNIAIVGITDHAQHELTDIVYVELPALNSAVEAGKECAVVESVKAANDIYAPVTGEVVAVNEDLSRSPDLVNRDPYGHGWFFKISMRDPSQLDELLAPEQYARLIGG